MKKKKLRRVVQRIENLEVLDRPVRSVARVASRIYGGPRVRTVLGGTWLGHPLHPGLTDIPIGFWAAAGVLDLVGGRRYAAAARSLVGLGLLSAVPAAASGTTDWTTTRGRTQRLGFVHLVGNVAGIALQASSYLARRRDHPAAGRMLGAIGLGFTGAAAYLGGHLSYVRGVGVNHTAFQTARPGWIDVAAAADLTADTPARVSASGVPVVLVPRGDQIYALSATCVHAGGPLDQGTLVDDDCLRCPWHGSVFRLPDGGAVVGPATTDQPRWETRVSAGRVQVRIHIGTSGGVPEPRAGDHQPVQTARP